MFFFDMFHWIAIHFLIHYLPFKKFAVCCCFSITRALNTAETAYEWSEVCFQLLVYSSIFSLKKWAYLKHERLFLYSNDRLIGCSSPSLSLLLFSLIFFLKKLQVAALLTFITCNVIKSSLSHISQQCTAQHLNTNRTVWVGWRLHYSYE